MATIYTLSSALPPQVDFINLFEELYITLDKIEGFSDEIQQLINDAKKAIESGKSILEEPNWQDRITTIFKTTDAVVDTIEEIDGGSHTDIINSNVYKSFKKLQSQWTIWSAEIGQQKKTINESIDYTKALDENDLLSSYPKADLALGLKVNSGAQFKLSVLNSAQSKAVAGITIPNDAVLVNQEIKAYFGVTASASGSYQAISLAAKASANGEVELDSYFQTNENTKTYSVLYKMYKSPLIPWSLKNMAQVIKTPSINGNVDGYRGFSLVREGLFGLSGEIGVGRSFNTISDVKNQPIDLSISAKATLSRAFSVKGKVEIFISKNEQNQLVVNVSTLDTESNSLYMGGDLGARVKGLDQIIRPQIEKLLGEGNEFVELIAENSTPGKNLVASLLQDVDDDLWAKPLVKVLLGEESTDAAINEMLGDEIESAFKKTVFNTSTSANTLAVSVFENIIDVFGVDNAAIENNDALKSAKQSVITKLEEKISDVQSKATEVAEKLKLAITQGTKEQLAPLAKLGEGIGEAIDEFDGNASKLYEKISIAYQSFSNKLEAVLEKSTNLQIGLQYLSSKEITESEEESFSIILKKPQSPSSEKLLRAIVLGDDTTTSALLTTLSRRKEIEYKPNSLRLKKLIESKVSLGINVIGFDTKAKNDVVSDLELALSASGKVSLVHKYSVSAASSGFNERRNTIFSLSYNVAEAALNKGIMGAISLSYTNTDNDLHSLKEMNSFLNSLTLNGLDEDIKSLKFAPIISNKECQLAKLAYKNHTSSKGASTTKYLAANSKSEIAITMRSDEKTFANLMNLNANDLFNKALLTQLYSDNGRYKNVSWLHYKPRLLRIIQGLQTVNPSFINLAKMFDTLNDYGKVSDNEVRNMLKTLDNYDDIFSDFADKDWNKVTSRLSTHFKKANALRLMIAELTNINEVIGNLPDSLSKEEAISLMNSLNKCNSRMESHLDSWVDVTSALQDLSNDVGDALGFEVEGLNSTLLNFMMLLQNTMKETDLYLVRIQLQRTDSDKRNIIMVS